MTYTLRLLFFFISLYAYIGFGQIELVKDINPTGSGNGGFELVEFKNEIYFSGSEDSSNHELWKSNGTESGTVLVKDLSVEGGSSPQDLTITNNYLYFTALQSGNRVLVRSDGSAAGTEIFTNKDGDPFFANNLTVVGNKIFFTHEPPLLSKGLLYVLYDDRDSVDLLTDPNVYGNSSRLCSSNDMLYFVTSSSTDGAGDELYKTDGTVEGTVLVKDIAQGPDNSFVTFLAAIGEKLFFRANGGDGNEPWVSDGSESGTYQIKDVNPGTSHSNASGFTGANDNSVFFSATDPSAGFEAFFTDATAAGTILLKDIREGSSSSFPSTFHLADSGVYFSAISSDFGRELFYSGGTTASTILVKDINPGASNSINVAYDMLWTNNRLYFVANNGDNGLELFVSDGTAEGTGMVQDLNVGSDGSIPKGLTEYNGDLYFFAEDTNGVELRKYDLAGDPCEGISCTIGEVCIDGKCQDACEGVTCQVDEFCDNGVCKDNCAGINCPIGNVCRDGTCFKVERSGFVYNEAGIPLADVMVIYQLSSGNLDTVTTGVDGFYQIPIDATASVIFDKNSYNPRKIPIRHLGSLDAIVLEKNTCLNITCPIGQVCYYGSCSDPNDVIDLSINVRDKSDLLPISDLRIEIIGIQGTVAITDINGSATVSVNDKERSIYIYDPDGLYESRIVTPAYSNVTIEIGKSSCAEIICPISEVCYAGSCNTPGSETTLSGYVFDQDSLPLSGVLVTDRNDSSTYTNINGYFSISLPLDTGVFNLKLTKTGHGSQYATVSADSLNEIYIPKEDPCLKITCPIGQVCHAGTCFGIDADQDQDLCDNIVCTIGEVCISGACHDPCNFNNSEFCPDRLNEDTLCDGITCGIGQICRGGSCFDGCSGNQSCGVNIIDPCENVTPSAGYICRQGVIVPDCPSNSSACADTNICNVIQCLPGENCFQCNRPNTGTSRITGLLNLPGLRGGKISSRHRSNYFVFLVDINSNEKVAIAKTDANGAFTMENVPSGEYRVVGTFRGYFMEDMTVVVNESENIELTFNVNDRFLEMSQNRLTNIIGLENKEIKTWFPSPNNGHIFYIKEKNIDDLKIYTLQGKEVQTNFSLSKSQEGTTLSLHHGLLPGVYLFQWTTNEKGLINKQRIFIIK